MQIPGLPPSRELTDEDKRDVFGAKPQHTKRRSRSDVYAGRIDILVYLALPIFIVLYSTWTRWFG
jgi:hypothetical protein